MAINDPSLPQGSELPFPTAASAPSGTGAAAGAPLGSAATSADTITGNRGADLLNRVVQGAHQTIDNLADRAAPHVQRLQEGVTVANESLHGRVDEVKQLGDEWSESLRTTVRDNPLVAVGAAVMLGMLISRLTR